MLLRSWEATDVLKSVRWLKAKNAGGAAIYIRPLGEHSFTLLDDLKAEALPRLKREGFEPCLVVETSPNNFQAWLNHGSKLPKEVSSAAARALAKRFGGDLGSADWRHFGRLSGLTNRKEKHQKPNGHFPFVRIVEANPGLVYRQAPDFVRGLEDTITKAAVAAARAKAALQSRREPRVPLPAPKTIADFHSDPRYDGDLSRADLAYTIYAIREGVPEAAIRAALGARDLSKKGGETRISDYIRRTLAKAAEEINRTAIAPKGPNRVRELTR
jgi:hypothetical protein